MLRLLHRLYILSDRPDKRDRNKTGARDLQCTKQEHSVEMAPEADTPFNQTDCVVNRYGL
jgi:hypothetical protein